MRVCSKTSASLNTAARTPSKNREMRRTRLYQEHFLQVKNAVLARHDKYTIKRGVEMDTWDALLEYARQPPVKVNDLFAIIWDAATPQTKQWIKTGLLERGFENNAQNQERWNKMEQLPAQASVGAAQASVPQRQDATNPYMVSFVSTARLPRPVHGSNARAFVF